jgi:hypothetical protein
MKIVIEDTWFPPGTKIRVGGGTDELTFLRCSFEGGEIFVEDDVTRPIFSRCIFHGTSFSGQTLSARISSECQSAPCQMESAATASVATRHARFRR